MSAPERRIQLIEKSLRCFVCGWLSLVPLLGLVAMLATFRLGRATRLVDGDEWNPAERYRAIGLGLASLGLLLFLIELLMILITVMRNLGVL